MSWISRALKKPPVITDDVLIDELLDRGVENVYPSREFLKSKLKKGNRLTLYLGIDPTGPTLHLGHVLPLKKLKMFQDLGHQIIFLIGDFTGMIGDPTDKTATRKKLTKREVLQNCKKYKEQAGKIISFSGPNRAYFKFNSKWLGKMNFGDVLELASMMTVQQMLERDMFAKRIEENKPIHIHEFMYPLMQGYDSVAMDVDGEVGGNDQTFNMLTGRNLVKTLKNKEKFVLTVRLLVDASGKKMGKSEGNMVSFDQTASDMFGKIMSWSDELIIPGFELMTDVPLKEIEDIKRDMVHGENPKKFKIRLAKEIVKIFHSMDAADVAYESFENTFKKGEIPNDIPQVIGERGMYLKDIVVKEKIVASNGEWKRLVEGRGVHEMEEDRLVVDYMEKLDKGVTLRMGKKRFVKILIK